MQYKSVPQIKIPISRIIMGCGIKKMWMGQNSDDILDGAIEAGINAFDTARGYGKSEAVLGEWMKKRNLQGKIYVQTKGALYGLFGNNRVKEKCIRADLTKSLHALRVNSVDMYLLHRDAPQTEVGVIIEWMNALHAEGKIQAYGVSNWTHTRIEAGNEYAYKHNLLPIALSQPQFSLAENEKWTWKGCVSVSGEKYREARAWYAENQLPLTAFSPLANGFLSGRVKADNVEGTKKYLGFAARASYLNAANIERLRRLEEMAVRTGYTPSQLALAWLLASEMNTFAVVGSGRKASLQQSAAAADIALTAEQCEYLNLQRDCY